VPREAVVRYIEAELAYRDKPTTEHSLAAALAWEDLRSDEQTAAFRYLDAWIAAQAAPPEPAAADGPG
jgi:hypothetical protein